MHDEPMSWDRLEELLEDIRDRLDQIEARLDERTPSPVHPYDSDDFDD